MSDDSQAPERHHSETPAEGDATAEHRRRTGPHGLASLGASLSTSEFAGTLRARRNFPASGEASGELDPPAAAGVLTVPAAQRP